MTPTTASHPRTLVREHLARELVNRGAWADAVFVDRATPIEEEEVWPNVCIYTNSDRTSEFLTNDVRKQELSLLVEIREKRPQRHLQQPAIEGMPFKPAQTGSATRLLDDACSAIEQLVFELFNNTRVTVEGQELLFDPLTEINTDLLRSAEGEVPHVLAQIEFKLIYQACFENPGPSTCALERFFGDIRHKTCNPADPLNGQPGVGLAVVKPQPELGNC